MKNLLSWLVVILALIVGIFLAADQANQSAAQRAYAQAAVIQAQSAARLDSTAAFLPYLVLAVVTIFGSALIFLGAVIYTKSPEQPQCIIERQVFIMIAPPGQSRADMWRALEGGKELSHVASPRNNQSY